MFQTLENIFENTCLEDLITAIEFIRALQCASHDDIHCKIDQSTIHRLRNPPNTPFDISSLPDLRLGLDLFLANMNSSVESFNANRDAIMRRHPADRVPSYDQMKRQISSITGVGSVVHAMCKNSCLAFTGPFTNLDHCPKCNEPKFCPGTKKAQQEFHTILLGPVLQALWRDASSAKKFYYRRQKTSEIICELQANSGTLSSYDDFFSGSDYLENVRNGNIRDNDIILMLSIDGAQLYAHKASDCWIYLWVIMDFSPDNRYKKHHVLPGGFIPGPNKPKNIDSFLFPGLHHVCAMQREGLQIWDASVDRLFVSQLFLALNTADGPAMAYLNGLVGHHGKFGCRLYCPVPGRHKPNGPHYYPALMKPTDYTMSGCDHEDLPFTHFGLASSSDLYLRNLNFLLKSPNETQYKKRRLETGITKPTIFLGFSPDRILGVPGCFGSDIMHLGTFNLADLLLSLWRGTLDHDTGDLPSDWPWAVLNGETWETHGKDVASATPFLPGSFDRPPRNIADKINSGYKAWEWLLYLYGLAPALLYKILPEPYYSHFCKLVRAMRIIHQYHIRVDDLQLANNLLKSFVEEYETLYYQRKVGRLHFCRQSIHALLHLAPKVTRIGPPICSSQWTMERTIGNLGEEIRQPSNPYANLSQRGLLRCQVNALKAMIPDLGPPQVSLPRGSIDLGDGYILLRAQDRYERLMHPQEATALLHFFDTTAAARSLVNRYWCPKVTRWARLRLPNGQVARSRWKECLKPLGKLRTARNVKNSIFTLAVLSLYSEPDHDLLTASHDTFILCKHLGDSAIQVIEVSRIKSVVAMVPYKLDKHGPEEQHYFLVERPGLDVVCLGGGGEDFS
ncbi:hypothetical protein HYPSUDRAFT_135758 [Hypholoma sublateritium FD-334 SS-4]|uniref:Uncharacterized protein n=1 Tax=Hypholoma sublateritium (strain FD-334 SS-4) TaxID=945553 RepID=A0A0D2MLK7_HYPSF|nr:hypothetical protein HYPSUDRAFT_135758 [Hypholoma sublateritium FD-334 SS-4]